MLAQRLIVAIILIPLGILLITADPWVFTAIASAVLGFAAWEYWRIFHSGGYHPSAAVMVAAVIGLMLSRQIKDFPLAEVTLALAILLAMTIQIVYHEKGSDSASLDFNITLGGIFYVGWLGSYFVAVHNLPDGFWWLLLILPACWISDGAAYFVGSHFGKHKIAPRVSPKKSWEGYFGGVIFGGLGTMLLAMLWNLRVPEITALHGLILGMAVSVIAPLGDLGESMLKRGFGIKDSGKMLPGHGGLLDRMDSWLWAVAIGYYLIVLVF